MKFIYEDETPLDIQIGDVFYKIASCDPQVFREPCRVCLDKHEITVNGVTFRCPCCNGEKEVCSIEGYYVKRYRVCGIELYAPHDNWKPSDIRYVFIKLYHKEGRGDTYVENIQERLDGLYESLNLTSTTQYNVNDRFFTDYTLAVSEAKKLTDEEKKKLEHFNTENGSSHEFVMKTQNDPKSN